MTPQRAAIIAGAVMALLLGLLGGVIVAKHDRPTAAAQTLTFLKRVPVTTKVGGTTRIVTRAGAVTTVTTPGINTTVIRTRTVALTPPTQTTTVTETVTDTVTTTGP